MRSLMLSVFDLVNNELRGTLLKNPANSLSGYGF